MKNLGIKNNLESAPNIAPIKSIDISCLLHLMPALIDMISAVATARL